METSILIYALPIAALLLILVASMSSKIEEFFESVDEEDYEMKLYQEETKDV